LLAELEFAVQDDDQSKSITFGPILQFALDSWQALANVYRIYNFDCEDDGKWDFAYATRILYQHTKHWGLAVEAYGTIDRLDDSGNFSEESLQFGDHDQHRIGPIVYYSFDMGWNPKALYGINQGTHGDDQHSELSIGIGWFFGMNNNTPDYTFKWSIEYEF